MLIEIYYDAACWNRKDIDNPPMGIGVAVYFDQQYQERFSRIIPYKDHYDRGTNNIGEWLALIDGLKVASELKQFYQDSDYVFYGDSDIICSQFNQVYAIKKREFQKYFKNAKEIFINNQFVQGSVRWIPREKNKQADQLSKQALNLIKDGQ